MINPWTKLNLEKKDLVLPCDEEYITSANKECCCDKNDYYYHTDILPEPFHGSPDAPIYLLLANPGFSNEEKEYHDKENFKQIVLKNLNHENSEYPFYLLNPKLKDSPGAKWWLKRVRHLVTKTSLEQVAKSLFTVELLAYHSKKFKLLSKKKMPISKNGLFPSSDYSIHLVNEAIRLNKHIIVMRSFRTWTEMVPQLKTYKRVYRLNSERSVYLSPNNLPDFGKICKAIQSNI